MLKTLILSLLTFITLFNSIGVNASVQDEIRDLKICDNQLFKDNSEEVYNYLKEKKENINGLYRTYFFSGCYQTHDAKDQYDKMHDNIAPIQNIDKQINNEVFENESNSLKAETFKSVDASKFVTTLNGAFWIVTVFEVFYPIDLLLSSTADLTGNYNYKEFKLTEFLTAVVLPISTPQSLRDQGINFDSLIALLYIIAIMIFVFKVFENALKVHDEQDLSTSEFIKIVYKKVLYPLIYLTIGLKLVLLISGFFINQSPLLIASVINANSDIVTCSNNKYSNGIFKDGYCETLSENQACYSSSTQICTIRYAIINQQVQEAKFVNTSELKGLNDKFNLEAIGKRGEISMTTPFNTFINLFLCLIFLVWYCFQLYEISKKFYTFYIIQLIGLLAISSEDNIAKFISLIFNSSRSYVASLALLAISMSILISLVVNTFTLDALWLIALAMGIPQMVGLVMKILYGVRKSTGGNLIDAGKASAYNEYSKRKGQVKKVINIVRRKKSK